MKDLTTAIMTQFTDAPGGVNNDFYDAVGGRLFKNEAPEGAELPYAVYLVVSDVPEYPGGKTIEQVLLQFSLFSGASSSSEIEDMLTALRALYDDCALTITDNTLIYFIRGNLTEGREEITTPQGTVGVWHYAQDYDIQTVQ